MIMEKKILDAAVDAATKAGKILNEGFRTSFKISSKEGRNNFVTEYDLLSEKIIIETLKKHFPDSYFLAEESGNTGKENANKIKWIIDPLDGTTNFAHSLPIFCISIAAELNNEIICSTIYQPVLDELFVAFKGSGAKRNGSNIVVSESSDFDSSFLVTGFPYNVNEDPCNCVEVFVDVIKQGIPVRRLGSAALDLAYVAAGIFDGFWEIELNPWDIAAGALLVEEAGGKVSTYSNTQFSVYGNSILATNGLIHNQIVDILNVSCNNNCNGLCR